MRFWNVQIEVYEYGAVKVAVAREREASHCQQVKGNPLSTV
jgi:hypothetical protein